MTDKLTDEQIIKALECCNSTERGRCLNKCPYYNYSASCTQSMINDALDLINRKDKRIAELQAENDRLQKAIKVQDIMIEQQDYKLKTAKSEAIKEFAERLKEKAYINNYCVYVVTNDEIDNLVKEMVGEE
jgi:7-keto-8-aminopelargonate synthetase-like enzyme